MGISLNKLIDELMHEDNTGDTYKKYIDMFKGYIKQMDIYYLMHDYINAYIKKIIILFLNVFTCRFKISGEFKVANIMSGKFSGKFNI
jgi:hypothetical protein